MLEPTRMPRAPRRVVVVDDSALAASIGRRIRYARRHNGLTQRQLAGDRYTAGYISALESGACKPSLSAMSYLGDRLGIGIGSLIGGADMPSSAAWRCSGIVCIHGSCRRHSAIGELYCGAHGGSPEYVTDPGYADA